MKRFIALAALFAAVFMVSCRKESNPQANNQPTVPTQQTHSLLRVMSNVSDADLRTVYLSLTPEEQRAVWQEHLDSFQAHHPLSAVQLTSLNALRSFVATVSFTDTSEDFIASFFNPWYDNAKNIFSSEDIYVMAFTLYDNVEDERGSYMIVGGGGGTGGGDSLPPCDCKQDNFFACVYNPDKCSNTKCSKSAHGCGLIWVQKCNARCRLI